MRKIGKALAAFTLAAGAALGSVAIGSPASAGGSLIEIGDVDVVVIDASGAQTTLLNNVSILQAAQVCQVNVDVLTAILLSNDQAACKSHTNNHQQAWVRKN